MLFLGLSEEAVSLSKSQVYSQEPQDALKSLLRTQGQREDGCYGNNLWFGWDCRNQDYIMLRINSSFLGTTCQVRC